MTYTRSLSEMHPIENGILDLRSIAPRRTADGNRIALRRVQTQSVASTDLFRVLFHIVTGSTSTVVGTRTMHKPLTKTPALPVSTPERSQEIEIAKMKESQHWLPRYRNYVRAKYFIKGVSINKGTSICEDSCK